MHSSSVLSSGLHHLQNVSQRVLPRRPTLRSGNSTLAFKPDASKSIAEKSRFRCQACRYPPCLACGKAMPHGTKRRFDQSEQIDWTCGGCLTLAESRRVHAQYKGERHTCTNCHTQKGKDAFSGSQWQNKSHREVICSACEAATDDPACTECGARVRRTDCTPSEWKNRSRRLLCKRCKRTP